MTTRGLPGFLRRSLRRDDFYTTSEDEDENSNNDEYGYDEGDNSIEDGESSTTEKNTLDPSPLAETLAKEDSLEAKNDDDDDDDQISMSSLGESESGKDAIHFANTSRLGESANHNSRRSSKRFSTGSKSYREVQFEKVLGVDDAQKNNHVIKMSELRKIAWNGVPPQFRGTCWKILLGYLPTNAMRRQQTLERKRAEYKDAIQQHYYIDDNSRTIQEQETLRQVLVDVPRTAPEVPLFRNEKIKRALSRLLYIWAMRHPASSYVQGINDLATPLFAVFLADDYEGEDVLDGSVMVVLEEDRLDEVRVLLDSVQILLPRIVVMCMSHPFFSFVFRSRPMFTGV